MTSAPTCGSCNWEMKQCGSAGDQCRNGACVVRAPQLGGSCTINWDCAKGECWRGPAASGAACREWVVFARLATRRRSSAGRASPAAQAALGSVGCRSRRAAIFAPPTPTVRRRLARPCATGSAGLWEPGASRWWPRAPAVPASGSPAPTSLRAWRTGIATGALTCRQWSSVGGACGGASKACGAGLLCTDAGVCASTGAVSAF